MFWSGKKQRDREGRNNPELEGSAEVDLQPIVLAHFLKPRSLSRAAPGWPDALSRPIVEDLLRREDIVPLGPPEQFDTCCTVPQLKEMLRARGLLLGGTKGVLIQRLLDAGVNPPAGDVKYVCSDAGRARAIAWQEQRAAALERSFAKYLELLKAHRVAEAIAQAREVNEAWPSMDQVAVRFNPLAIAFDPARVSETVKADLRQNIKLVAEVGVDDVDMIYGAALHSILSGGDLHTLFRVLMTIDGMGERRAEDLSRSLNNKASALIQAERYEQLGIKYAIWRYSGAPCGSQDPRDVAGAEQDTSHKAADGKPYLTSKGMLLNGRWTWPGREDGCKCFSTPILP
jgi:hypothetical protein